MSDVKPVAWAAFEGPELICVHHDRDKCIELARLAMAPNKPTFDVAPLTTGLTLQAEIEALRKDAERYENALEQLRQWAQAYPLEVFPEPDFKKTHEVLTANGMTLDAISAFNMRHVITKVIEIIDAAIAKEKQP